jgi:hypothetical protein
MLVAAFLPRTRTESMETVFPVTVIDLRDPVTCARCGEPLAIAAYDYNGDTSALQCADCCAIGATAVTGTATVTSSAEASVDATA